MRSLMRKLFSKDVDNKVDAIFEEGIRKPLQSAANESKGLRDLLKKNGVTLQIYIATGGDKNHD